MQILNDHISNVIAIDYSQLKNSLYSISNSQWIIHKLLKPNPKIKI